MRTFHTLALLPVLLAPLLAQEKKPGYTDTPRIPGQKWRVHDADRPRPKVVTPGKAGGPPADAVVLFDGKNLDAWKGRKGPAQWKVADGYFEVVPRTGTIGTRQEFGDCQLHIEFATPKVVKGHSQGRGNSGVFFFGRYEVQILDSYKNPSYADGQCGALYGQYPPLVNASRGPGEWQSYDIIFKAPRFKDGKLESPAYVTVIHNGVLIHHHVKLIGPTSHKRAARYRPHGPTGPITLQDHGNPTRFRNIWLRKL